MIFQEFLVNSMVFAEGIAALTSIFLYKKTKNTHYQFFSYYLIFIFISEMLSRFGFLPFPKISYYNNFVIPVEFIMLYWLYAWKSLNNRNLFFIFTALYLLSFIPNELYFTKNKVIYSFNYTFGSFLLMFLVIMEYYKQINSDNILNFSKNRMFYINLGVTLFYIGTLPFWAFYFPLLEHMEIYEIYRDYFWISGIIMYLLFASSFIWGKRNYS